MGGAINFVCHSNDTWSCACNNYFNTTSTSPDFTQLESYDGDSQNCSQNVGVSDGAEQSKWYCPMSYEGKREEELTFGSGIEGFLVNICIALPDVTSAVTASVSPSPTSTSAAPKNSKSGVATREDPSLAFLEVSFVLGCMVF
jgi:hypothetical protein